MLFSNIERTDLRPASHVEPIYSYIDRSARPEICRVRKLLEEWFNRYPEDHRGELLFRLTNDDNYEFQSAFFELYLHELLLCLGYTVKIHPKLSSAKGKHPDFLACIPGENDLVIEAALVTDLSDSEKAIKKNKNHIYDFIDKKLKSPDFFISINIKRNSTTTIPVNNLVNELDKWIKSLDYEQLSKDYLNNNLHTLAKYNFKYEDWKIEFSAIPKYKYRGGKNIRNIGLKIETKWVTTDKSIKKTVIKKATRYGDIKFPYIIALNVLSLHLDKTDIMEALFGKESFLIDHGVATPTNRIPNGALWGPKGPQNTRVSGIIIFNDLKPWYISRNNLCLWKNPWAKIQYNGPICRLTQAIPDPEGKNMLKHEGEAPYSLFNLTTQWPEG